MSEPQDDATTDDGMLSWRRPEAPQTDPSAGADSTVPGDGTSQAAETSQPAGSDRLDWNRARPEQTDHVSGGVERVPFPTRRGPDYIDPYATAPTAGSNAAGSAGSPWAAPSPTFADAAYGNAQGVGQGAAHASHRRRRTGVGIAVVAALATGAAVALVGGNLDNSSTRTKSALGHVSSTNRTTPMTTDQIASAVSAGLVDITTTLQYQNASAAGTGMVLTSDGEILTNNHVVRGATSISVTVVTTGKTYSAKVVGTDASDDVAVIQLSGAQNLQTVPVSTAAVSVGNSIVAIGNAGGKGGTPSVVTGQVTAVNQSITASDEDGSNPETLNGLIQVDAPIVAGDSGGALANTYGNVVGMNTAASSNNGDATMSGAGSVGYAIPIKTALTIADKIENGQASTKIHIGGQAFMGISLAQDSSTSNGQDYGLGSGFGSSSVSGAVIEGFTDNSPAEAAGITQGATITSVDGKTVSSNDGLSALLDTYKPGDKIKVGWTDSSGASQTSTVTLIEGPAK